MKNDTRMRFTLRLPKELLDLLLEESNIIGVSVNAWILQILWKWVEEKKKAENEK